MTKRSVMISVAVNTASMSRVLAHYVKNGQLKDWAEEHRAFDAHGFLVET